METKMNFSPLHCEAEGVILPYIEKMGTKGFMPVMEMKAAQAVLVEQGPVVWCFQYILDCNVGKFPLFAVS